MSKRLPMMIAACLLLAACRGVPAEPQAAVQQHPPHPGVQLQLSVVDPDREGPYAWQGRRLALESPALASSADLLDVRVSAQADYPALDLSFRPEADARLRQATAGLVGRQIAVTVDDQVLTVATVHGPFGGQMQVRSGTATQEEMQALARYITEGGTPVQLH